MLIFLEISGTENFADILETSGTENFADILAIGTECFGVFESLE